MITAEEFVIAGDYIVCHCPTWCWCVVRLRWPHELAPICTAVNSIMKAGWQSRKYICNRTRLEYSVYDDPLPYSA